VIVRPSALHRTVACPYSLIASVGHDDSESSDDAKLGTCAHSVSEIMLNGGAVEAGEILGGVEVTTEMLDHVGGYVDYLKSLDCELYIERHVDIPRIHPQCSGTPDGVAVGNNVTRVADLKYGRRPVSPVHLPQLIAYASAIGDLIGCDDNHIFELVIYQPRTYSPLGPIKVWRVSWADIKVYAAKIADAVMIAFSDNPHAQTGSHCHYCPIAHKCETLAMASYNAIDIANYPISIDGFNNLNIGQCLENLERAEEVIKLRADALRVEVEERLRMGARIPMYELTPSKGATVWDNPQMVEDVAKIAGVDVFKRSLMTPKQVIKAGISENIIGKLSTKKPGAFKVTRVNNDDATMRFNK